MVSPPLFSFLSTYTFLPPRCFSLNWRSEILSAASSHIPLLFILGGLGLYYFPLLALSTAQCSLTFSSKSVRQLCSPQRKPNASISHSVLYAVYCSVCCYEDRDLEPSEQKCSCAYVFSQFLQGLSLDIKEYRAFGLAHRTACYYLADYHEKGFQDKCNENQCKMKINIIKHIIISLWVITGFIHVFTAENIQEEIFVAGQNRTSHDGVPMWN